MAIKYYSGINISGSIVPSADSTFNLGGPAFYFANVYADNLYGDGSNITNIGAAESALTLTVTVKNKSGGSLAKGTVVHAAPSANPPSGNVIEVIAADYDTVANMPGLGVLNETLANDAEGEAIMFGAVSGIDTSSFLVGTELYVGNNGGLTGTKPATAGQLIQKIAVVIKSHATNGLIKIFGAGRTNDVPLPLYIDNTNQRVGISQPNPSDKLHINGGDNFNGLTIEGTAPGVYLKDTQGTNAHHIGSNANYLYFLEDSDQNGSYNNILAYFKPNNDFVFNIGSVGIGTSTPSKKLDVAGDWILDGINGGHFENYTWGSQLDISELTSGGWARANRIVTSDSDASVFYGVFGGGTTLNYSYWNIGSAASESTNYNNSNGVFLLKNGNVGIGTTSPSYKLEVSNTSADNGIAVVSGTSSLAYLNLGDSTVKSAGGIRYDNSSDSLILRGNSQNYVTIDSSGQTRFKSSTDYSIGLTRSGNDEWWLKTYTNGAFALHENGVGDQFTILAGGNVGIGTTSPSEKLEVQGAVRSLEFIADGGAGNNGYDFASSGSSPSVANMFCPSGYTLAFGTNNSERARIDANGRLNVYRNGNTNGGTLLLGANTSGAAKWSYLAGAHYNQASGSGNGSGSAGVALIGCYSNSTQNNVYIGGNPYEINPATNIFFHTHNAPTHTLGGTMAMSINSSQNVGIGLSSASYKLDVNGDINTRSTYLVSGSMLVNTSRRSIFLNSFASGGGEGIFFRDGFTYNCSITAEDHNGSSADGICISGYDGVSFSTGSNSRNERMRIASNGNVGIGTTSPSYLFEVNTSSVSTYVAHFTKNGTSLGGMYIDSINNGEFYVKASGNNTTVLLNSSGSSYLNGGNVGIGTTSPDVKLEVIDASPANGVIADFVNSTNAGGTIAAIKLSNADSEACDVILGANRVGANFGSDFFISLSDGVDGTNQERFRITEAGNVGIGTTTPARKLQVQGSGYFTGEGSETLLLGRVSGQSTIKADASNGGYLIMDSTNNIAALNWYSSQNVVIAQGGGNVLIGSPYVAPNARLHVRDDNAGGIVARMQNDANGAESAIRFQAYTTGGSVRYADIAFVPDTQTLTIRSPYNSVGGFDVEDGGDVRIRTASGYVNIGALNTTWAHFYTDRGGYYFNEKVIVDGGTIGSYNEDLLLVRADLQSDYIRIADTYIGFYLDGNEDMRLTNSGHLGINQTNPQSKLHITNASGGSGGYLKVTDAGYNGDVRFGMADGINNDAILGVWTNNNVRAYTNGQERMRINSNGVIEINPNKNSQRSFRVYYDMEVYNSVLFTDTSYNIQSGIGGTAGALVLYSNGTSERMRIDSAGNVGINTTSPQAKLDVKGGILTRNTRVNDSQAHPVGHYNEGEQVFGIDPTWSQSELQQFFNSSNVTWNADSTAPGGYAIYINGGVNVGGVYTSGFPYIPVDQDDYFYMEVWIRNAGSGQTHYMGSNEYDQNFTSLGGHPGSFGYWVMSNTNPGSSWTKVSGYIGGFSASTVGTFENGTKYWTPMALFNYGSGSGTRACYISGWKVYRVTQHGNRTFTGTLRSQSDIIAYYSSDKHLKNNITPISNPIDKINLIGGYEFDWNDKQDVYKGHDVGVVAQEIEEIMPEIVTTRKDGYKAVKYEKIVPLLIEAIKEQQKQINELKARLDGSTY